MHGTYDSEFFAFVHRSAARSAKRVVPLLLELFRPRSVVDLGCGLGTWLAAFGELGVEDRLGVDGDYVDLTRLEIPRSDFVVHDLSEAVALPRTFDLAVSLEVAEHLPEAAADTLVASLASLAPVVVFSAAIPGQGGVGHVNEQWPDYWAEKFAASDYAVVDCLRPVVWCDEDVDWWYAQNALAFVRRDELARRPDLRETPSGWPLAIVHPRLYAGRNFMIRWLERVGALRTELARIVPRETKYILVDDQEIGPLALEEREQLPFLECRGVYWGTPEDSETAIREVERLAAHGAAAIVFAWPSLWWLDYYDGFAVHLRERFRCVAESDLCVAFSLSERMSAST